MKRKVISRRRFLLAASGLVPCAIFANAAWIEPRWLKIRRRRFTAGKTAHRLVHFTDLHYKGNQKLAQSVVATINSLAPDFVCFTGDLVEDADYLPEALTILSGIKSPLYGVPGNHDYWAQAPFIEFRQCFAGTGGAWLTDEQRMVCGNINLIGASCRNAQQPLPAPQPGMINILLIHYPAWVKNLTGLTYDLILAGHSHGGQVRIPLYGAIMLPFLVDEYDLGLFHTPAGPLYVNPGIGCFAVPYRFNCRPEITVIEI